MTCHRISKPTHKCAVKAMYIHIEKMMYAGAANDQFIVKVADTMDEAIWLMKVGFEYRVEVEGHKLFRKLK